MRRVAYNPENLTTFDREWGLHKKISEWWYCTGILEEPSGKVFAYQFTLIHIAKFPVIRPSVLMLALTDMQTGEHHYSQKVSVGRDVTIEADHISFGDRTDLVRDAEGISLQLKHAKFSLDLRLDWGKGAVWHCDQGKLYMGSPGDEKNTTYYFSYTNMPTTGTLTFKGQQVPVTGRTWFDKQGGNYALTANRTHWEWFSLRFHDDEEIMLFAFPHMNYFDGTYIAPDGSARRLNDYTLTTTRVIEHRSMEWSAGWNLTIPGVKEEEYTITPKFDGNINFAYFEELCSVTNRDGDEVGLAFVELLPGVRNDKSASSATDLFRSVEY